jgi:hypothetical protein
MITYSYRSLSKTITQAPGATTPRDSPRNGTPRNHLNAKVPASPFHQNTGQLTRPATAGPRLLLAPLQEVREGWTEGASRFVCVCAAVMLCATQDR